MKTREEKCSVCNMETLHDTGMKMAHNGDKHYIRRTTSRCRRCGTREINNKIKGRRIIVGKNEVKE